METIVGVGVPLLLLFVYELSARSKGNTAPEFLAYAFSREQRRVEKLQQASAEESSDIQRQNRFGLRVIAVALLFTAAILFLLSAFTTSGAGITAAIALVILLAAAIPFRASQKILIGEIAGLKNETASRDL
jgi:SSS family solute:Na+ symporter